MGHQLTLLDGAAKPAMGELFPADGRLFEITAIAWPTCVIGRDTRHAGTPDAQLPRSALMIISGSNWLKRRSGTTTPQRSQP